MIALMIGAAIASAPLAEEPSFGLLCKAQGTLSSDNKFVAFPAVRIVGLFARKSETKLEVVRTFDPQSLLAGQRIVELRPSIGNKGYLALTPTDPVKIAIKYTAPTGSARDWEMALPTGKISESPSFVMGRCILMDGVTETEFDQLTSSIGASKK